VVHLRGLVRHLRAGLEARRLAQHHHVAELHARNHEGPFDRRARHTRHTRHVSQQRRLLGRAPVGLDAALRLDRQRAKPREVARQRQRVGQVAVEQGLQGVALPRRVVGLHRRLHLRDERVGARQLGAVAGGLHRRQHVVHAARHVEKRRTEVRLARRVVVDQHRHAALGRRRALQAQQGGGLASHGVDLRGQRRQRAGGRVPRADQHRVGHAGQLARAVVRGNVGLREAVLALRPLRGVHGQRRQRLQHRHADALQLGLALVRAEHQSGIDDGVGHALLAGMRHAKEQVLLLARAVEGVGTQAAFFERGDERVEPAGVVAGDGGAVDGDGDGALVLAWQLVDGGDVGLDARPARVVQARQRQRDSGRQARELTGFRQRLHCGPEVGRARKAPVLAQPLRPCGIDPALGHQRRRHGGLALRDQREFADQHVRRGAARDRVAEARRGGLRHADVRRVDDQQPRAVERGGQRIRRIGGGRHHLQRHASLARRGLHAHHARGRHQRGAEHHDARRRLLRMRRCQQKPQRSPQHPEEEEEEARHFPPCAGTASAGT
jgi:hypothetical protein